MAKHTNNYYHKRIREILDPIFKEIEKQHPGCTIYPYIVSWSRSNPFESWVNFDLCGHDANERHWTDRFITATSYENLYEMIKTYEHLKENILHSFNIKCLKIQ